MSEQHKLREPYIPRHKGIPMCEVCEKRPQFDPGSAGLGGALCLVCYYDL